MQQPLFTIQGERSLKVLSIRQPWASLVVLGVKQIETRSWFTPHRGDLGIHASARRPAVGEYAPGVRVDSGGLLVVDGTSHVMPLGAVLGTVTLVDVVPSHRIIDKLSEVEHALGEYQPGWYGWLVTDPVVFDAPVPKKGRLSLWDLA